MHDRRLVLTVDEAAEALGIARRTAYLGVREGRIPNIRIGRRILVPLQALQAMLRGDTDDKEGQQTCT